MDASTAEAHWRGANCIVSAHDADEYRKQVGKDRTGAPVSANLVDDAVEIRFICRHQGKIRIAPWGSHYDSAIVRLHNFNRDITDRFYQKAMTDGRGGSRRAEGRIQAGKLNEMTAHHAVADRREAMKRNRCASKDRLQSSKRNGRTGRNRYHTRMAG